jgi:hypothetical protein
MMQHFLTPGMQYGQKAELRSEQAWVSSNPEQGF